MTALVSSSICSCFSVIIPPIGVVRARMFTGLLKYAYIHSPPMKYSPGSLILTKTDDGWLLEVLLDSAKTDEPVVMIVVSSVVFFVNKCLSEFLGFFMAPFHLDFGPPQCPVIYQYLICSSTGRKPASLCHVSSVMRSSIRALTFYLNIFFSETTNQILMKFAEMFLPWSSSKFLEII